MKSAEYVARRLVWWKPTGESLADSDRLLARVMAYGALTDVQWMLEKHGKQACAAVLQNAPPGIFDARSWRYWRLVLGLPPGPMPRRTFEARQSAAAKTWPMTDQARPRRRIFCFREWLTRKLYECGFWCNPGE
ncbi:MAG: hypothetical protein ACRESX_01950 [Gammaproteobacteria bacterium]